MAAIKIRHGDLEIEVQDAAGLRTVLEVMGERQLRLPISVAAPRNGQRGPRPVVDAPTEEAFQRFYRHTEGKSTRRFVDALYQRPGSLNDSQARNLLGFGDSNLKLAGVSSAVVKTEKKAGLPAHAAVASTRNGKVGDYTYHYRLTPACRQALEPLMAQMQNGEAPA